MRDDALVAAPVFAEQQAQLFGLDHAGGAARLAAMKAMLAGKNGNRSGGTS